MLFRSASARESWADRVMRLEKREVEVKEQEEKMHGDVERFMRDQEELASREKAAQEALQTASRMQADAGARRKRSSSSRWSSIRGSGPSEKRPGATRWSSRSERSP